MTLIALLLAIAGCSEARVEGREAGVEGRATGPAAADTALERMAEELLPAVEAASGLRGRRPLALARTDRARLAAFLTGELDEDLPPAEARALVDAYARFGLLEPGLDLRALLRSLYLEQVVGYYDPASDTLFVREGVGRARLRPVLVHEMVHALQDQHMDLDSTLIARREDNDAAMAARAALEGHATFVMLEWQLSRRSGREVDLTALPGLRELLGRVGVGEATGMPALADAPPLVRSSLLFPYVGGVAFVQGVWRGRAGREPPLGEDLPTSTEQVLHPERFMGDRDAPSRLRFDGEPPSGWSVVHQDGLGEFETAFFLEAFLADTARARAAARGWDADRYRLLREDDGSAEVLVWVSAWDSASEAAEFAGAVEAAFRSRYADAARVVGHGEPGAAAGTSGGEPSRVVRIRVDEEADVPAVVVVDRPLTVEEATAAGFADYLLSGAP